MEYGYNSLGEVTVTSGDGVIGAENSILCRGGYIYDFDAKLYYTCGGVYLPKGAVSVLNGTVLEHGNFYAGINSGLKDKAVNIQYLLKDKVKEVVTKNFASQGIETEQDVIVTDRYNYTKGTADIFTLPMDLTNFNYANLINGNQIYEVALNDTASINAARNKVSLLADANSGYKVDYIEECKPLSGTVTTEGHFIYFNKYVY